MGKLFAYAFAFVQDNATPVAVRIMMDGSILNAVGHDVADVRFDSVIRTLRSAQAAAKRPGAGHTANYSNAGLSAALTAKLPSTGVGVYSNVFEMILTHGTGSAKHEGYLSSITAHERMALVAAVKANYEA